MRKRPLRTRRRRPTRHRAPYQGARFDWRDLPPLPVEERIEVPLHPSQTFLGKRDRCHRSAHLYLKHRGGPGSHELARGTLYHLTMERIAHLLIEKGERTIGHDDAKVILYEVMADHPELTVTAAERDYLRMLAYHSAVGWALDPTRVIGVEEFLTLQLGKWTIRGKIDLLTKTDVNMLDVDDYKTQRNMPTSDEWAAQTFDDHGNPRWAGNFQTQVY